MRKKWLWLLVLPILGCGAIFWARDRAWKKVETDFRRDSQMWVNETSTIPVFVSDSAEHRNFGGDLTKKKLFVFIKEMRLMPRSSRISWPGIPENIPLLRIPLSDGGSVGEPFGFYLALDEDKGWINLPAPDWDKWNDYQLTPECCRLLKKQIFALKQNEETGELVEAK